jgi:hypothetical protein
MKYIKRLNIDFDNWDELNNECTYLIFNNGYDIYFGYIKNNYCYLLNSPHKISLKAINNINAINDNTLIYYKYNILYKNLIKTDFYKNNKILIVGIDVDYINILKNPESYVNNNECETKIKLK